MAKVRINVAKKFKLHTINPLTGGHEYTDYAPGSHVVPQEHADHWYTKLHLQPESEADLKKALEEAQDLASDKANSEDVLVDEEDDKEEDKKPSRLSLRKGK